MKIGCFLPISNGLSNAVKMAHSYGASTLMIYTGSPKSYVRSDMSKYGPTEGQEKMAELGIDELVVHAAYIINIASDEPKKQAFARSFLKDELARTQLLGGQKLVVHTGYQGKMSKTEALDNVVTLLNDILTPDSPMICLETMAGKGTELGGQFSDFQYILEHVTLPDKVGICLDTCHIFDAGYDIVNHLEDVLKEIENTVCLSKIQVIHLNGSLNDLGSHKDRHAGLEDSNNKIGLSALKTFANLPCFEHIPKILETPWNEDGSNNYTSEIAAIQK